jgi:hypothetical protein
MIVTPLLEQESISVCYLNDYRLKPVGSFERLKVAVQAKTC